MEHCFKILDVAVRCLLDSLAQCIFLKVVHKWQHFKVTGMLRRRERRLQKWWQLACHSLTPRETWLISLLQAWFSARWSLWAERKQCVILVSILLSAWQMEPFRRDWWMWDLLSIHFSDRCPELHLLSVIRLSMSLYVYLVYNCLSRLLWLFRIILRKTILMAALRVNQVYCKVRALIGGNCPNQYILLNYLSQCWQEWVNLGLSSMKQVCTWKLWMPLNDAGKACYPALRSMG